MKNSAQRPSGDPTELAQETLTDSAPILYHFLVSMQGCMQYITHIMLTHAMHAKRTHCLTDQKDGA